VGQALLEIKQRAPLRRSLHSRLRVAANPTLPPPRERGARTQELAMVFLSRIYTRSGDTGDTGLGDGTRVPKDHPRVSAYGSVDELNAVLGLLVSHFPQAGE